MKLRPYLKNAYCCYKAGYQVVADKTADQLFDICLIQPFHAAKLGVYEMQYTAIGGILLLGGS